MPDAGDSPATFESWHRRYEHPDMSIDEEAERAERLAAWEAGQAALLDRVRALLAPFALGHLYHDEEFKKSEDRDRWPLNHHDPTRSPKVGDCRRVAEFLNQIDLPGG